jgi:hypothetical protein
MINADVPKKGLARGGICLQLNDPELRLTKLGHG